MKKVFVLGFFSTISLASIVYASHPWLGKTIPADDVRKRWGAKPFNESEFRASDRTKRASMAYSLMTSKKLVGLTASEVRSRLGDFDGHYFSESYPTYLIQKAAKPGDESWQLVFIIDENKKTKDIIVHKNCCD